MVGGGGPRSQSVWVQTRTLPHKGCVIPGDVTSRVQERGQSSESTQHPRGAGRPRQGGKRPRSCPAPASSSAPRAASLEPISACPTTPELHRDFWSLPELIAAHFRY